MITRVDLWHFKCFETLKLPLCQLTLLSGTNASGKSSVLQAMALLHQTMREHEWSSRLMLNGSSIRLGTQADVVDQAYGRQAVGIGLIDSDAAEFQWVFGSERDDMSMEVRKAWGKTGLNDPWVFNGLEPLRFLAPLSSNHHSLTDRLCRLTYLTAERLGPRESYLYDDPMLTPVVGSRGEHTISILHSGRNNKVLPGLIDDNAPPTRFRQVEARMAQFFPGCVLAVEQVPRTNAVTLGIRLSESTDFHRPVHTGFGLTQVLPIVVAALSAGADDLLLIENPEVHLHPAGQTAMGFFLAQIAAAGVQVIVETHSDHVLNGIRRAVKGGRLPSNGVALHFFRPRSEESDEGESQVQTQTLDSDGNIDSWPDGFFDQFDKDMNYFAGWS